MTDDAEIIERMAKAALVCADMISGTEPKAMETTSFLLLAMRSAGLRVELESGKSRDDIIEQCAVVAEGHAKGVPEGSALWANAANRIAGAIRALKGLKGF